MDARILNAVALLLLRGAKIRAGFRRRGDVHVESHPCLVFPPVTDVVAREVVVPTVHLSYPRSVQVHRDRRVVARVSYPVNSSVVGQDARGSVFYAPLALPDLSQAGMIQPGAVIQTLVALLEYGSHGTAINSPGGMVVDLCLCAWGPDKNLQRVAVVLASIAVCHVPLTYGASRIFQEWANLTFEKGGVLNKTDQERSGLL